MDIDTRIKYISNLSDNKVEFCQNKLTILKDLDFWEWEALGNGLKQINACIQWWIGDWLNYGERKYGEMYSQALDAFEYEEKTLRNYKYVASAVEMSLRKDNLSFSHHAAIASLPVDKQKEFLDKAEKEDLSVAHLKNSIKKYKRRDNEPCSHIWVSKCSICGETAV